MATIAAVVNATYAENTIKITWTSLVAASLDGGAILSNWMDYSDRSFQVLGTFNGATVTIQGSNNDGTNWDTVNDAFGNALTFTAAGLKQVTEAAALMRPLTSAAGGSTDLTVICIARKPLNA